MPFAIYFSPSQARQVILRDGIRPKRKSSSSTFSAVKLLPSPTPDPLSIQGPHPLRGTTDACIIVDVHKMFQDNISFVTHSSDGCYGTDTVPLPPQFCRCLYFFSLWLTPNFAYSWIFVACPPLFPTEIRVTCLQRG